MGQQNTETHITLKKLAQRLNLSISTVSRALADHPNIKKETIQRVKKLAQKLEYSPNSIARSLKSRATKTIGVIVPEIKHDFFSKALDGIEDRMFEAEYSILLCKTNEKYERELIHIPALLSKQVAGFLVSVSQTTKTSDHFKSILRRNIPLVFFDRTLDDIEVGSVIVDDSSGAFRAVDYLIRCGYRRIAHLSGPETLDISQKRIEGYTRAHEKHGLSVRREYIIHGGMDEKDGERGLELLYRLAEPPDAIFAVNDPVAIGVHVECRKRNIRIPQDLALIGFSDNTISSLITPALTTVRQPAYEIGAAAADMLLNAILNPTTYQPHQVTLKTELIVRETA